MARIKLAEGIDAHSLPADLKKALQADKEAAEKWNGITALSRNEWICWTISVKRAETRADHVSRVVSELKEGMRRPCCWVGCMHRKDKAMNPTQKWIAAGKPKS